jgi:hypothetical protein
MALSAIETTRITDELMIVFKQNAPTTRDVMLTAGVAGEAAKSTDVQTVVATVLANLYGQTAPTVSP